MIYRRTLNLLTLLKQKSFFLFGPRATGKTYLIRQQLADNYPVINLLRNEIYMQLSEAPSRLEQMILGFGGQPSIVVIDEIQLIPALLNEVHRLIEEQHITFLLTGSSARKLKHGHANLLAGRARKAELFPLTYFEIPDFNLKRYLHVGGLPAIYPSKQPFEELAAYTDLFLKEEIQAEALVRKIINFSRFLPAAAFSCGKLINFTKIGSDLGIPTTTIREYFNILEDCFIGFMLPAFSETTRRRSISTSKFYVFDIGVKNYLLDIKQISEKTELFGDNFEHFIALELRAYLSYRRIQKKLTFWRSKSGFEVDFLIGKDLAIEVKTTEKVNHTDLKGLTALQEENLIQRYIVVSRDPIAKKLPNGIEIMPWQSFLTNLWHDDLIKSTPVDFIE